MKITLSSVFVNDQDKALKFYTEVLGFVKKTDIPLGAARWLTVVSPEGRDDLSCFSSRWSFHPPGLTRQPCSWQGYP